MRVSYPLNLCLLEQCLSAANSILLTIFGNFNSRSCGLFRITDPEGMNILKGCEENGFHPHTQSDNGSAMYEHCSNVYKNSNLRFEIFDLR